MLEKFVREPIYFEGEILLLAFSQGHGLSHGMMAARFGCRTVDVLLDIVFRIIIEGLENCILLHSY